MAFHSGEMSSSSELSSKCTLMWQGHLDMVFISGAAGMLGDGQWLGVIQRSPFGATTWQWSML